MIDFARIDDDYCIDSLGNVYSRPRKHATGGVLKHTLNADGYPCVRIHRKTRPVHRLLAETFIPKPSYWHDINHRDGNKRNFALSNLEWCDAAKNNQHAWDTGLQSRKSSTGERHITTCRQTGRFRVIVRRVDLGRFLTLQDAIDARNRYLSML